MTATILSDDGHIARYCSGSRLRGDGMPDGTAFYLREGIDDYLSVNWLEYFTDESRTGQINSIRAALLKKGRRINASSIFALLNIGLMRQHVHEALEAARDLRVQLENDLPEDPSHSGVHGYTWEESVIGDLIAECVEEIYPGRAD